MGNWISDLYFSGAIAESAAARIQRKWRNYRTWTKLAQIFRIQIAKRNEVEITNMISVLSFWRRFRAKMALLTAKFEAYREKRLSEIREKLKRARV
jgi:hypothetical protein